jgi:hypothetical protein
MYLAMTYTYYYNRKEGETPWRNNLIYTSLVNEEKTVFVQWYNNDTEYHKGQNQVVDPAKMEEKWNRELKYLTMMETHYPELIPEIIDIDEKERKIYLSIHGDDFWQQSMDQRKDFDRLLPNWREQMLNIISAHKSLGLYKYSMHPSSYFIIDGKLKSINYFFTYHKDEGKISIAEHQSHISEHRQEQMKSIVESNGISWTEPQEQSMLQDLCFESFSTNYPRDFIEDAKKVYRK